MSVIWKCFPSNVTDSCSRIALTTFTYSSNRSTRTRASSNLQTRPLVLVLGPPGTEAEFESAVREKVERRRFTRQHRWVVQILVDHRRSEANRARDRGRVRKRRHGGDLAEMRPAEIEMVRAERHRVAEALGPTGVAGEGLDGRAPQHHAESKRLFRHCAPRSWLTACVSACSSISSSVNSATRCPRRMTSTRRVTCSYSAISLEWNRTAQPVFASSATSW